MGFFTKQPEESRLHHVLKIAFDHVKRDTTHIFEWLRYFHKKHQQHDERLAKIEQQLAYLPQTHQEIKQIVDYYSPYQGISEKIERINARLTELEQKRAEKSPGLKERLLKKITRNSKDYIKSVILSLIKKYEQISAPQLKEIVVEEQGLCSKSSFYRLLAELESLDEVSCFQSGKEKTYMLKTQVVK